MTYNPSIPQATDLISESQQDILDNFTQLNTQFGVNHLPLTTVTPQAGYHSKIYFPTGLGADPGLTAPECALYPKIVSGVCQLFFQNSAAGTPQQITGNTAPVVVGNDTFFSIFGINFAVGFFVAVGATATVTFAGNIGTPRACVATQSGDTGGSRACTIENGTFIATGCRIKVSNTNSAGWYIAIGTA